MSQPFITAASGSLTIARQRVLGLYRDCQRAAPKIVTLYELDFPADVVRAKIREEFEKNRFVNDVGLLDILIFKGQAELRETMMKWKQNSQLMQYFYKDEVDPKATDFLSKFYENRD
ncbi:ndufa6 NADH-ubiquinone oxidoreductase subunit [Basidiobolus ranarum]|uniref:Ndufa6 NADH-ubiquinone oxidoreductase subunit n=1 Tax=Basidiobolus ranarum TaxID=34480 RepID=A0ABR2VVB8_9FUNG